MRRPACTVQSHKQSLLPLSSFVVGHTYHFPKHANIFFFYSSLISRGLPTNKLFYHDKTSFSQFILPCHQYPHSSPEMASSSPVPRSHSRNSFYSTTTYHSFQDVELYEPPSTSTASHTTGLGLAVKDAPIRRLRPSRGRDDIDNSNTNNYNPSSFKMVRQDSGYESSTPPPPRSSHSSSRRNPNRHSSTTSSKQQSSSSPPRPASQTRVASARGAPKRPSLRRTAATCSGPISHLPARSSLTISRSQTSTSLQQQQTLQRKHSYFQFPSPEHLDGEGGAQEQGQPIELSTRPRSRPSVDLAPVILTVNTANENSNRSPDPNSLGGGGGGNPHHTSTSTKPHPHHEITQSPISPYSPPQTTHYWTSDRTRRLEYAAIDAASRGVRGWVMRNMVPECFVPREKRFCARFDDDSGSVRRYRLDLDMEIECPEESVPPSPVGEKPRGFRARAKGGWWSRLRGCT